jgi:hypothetical protein
MKVDFENGRLRRGAGIDHGMSAWSCMDWNCLTKDRFASSICFCSCKSRVLCLRKTLMRGAISGADESTIGFPVVNANSCLV